MSPSHDTRLLNNLIKTEKEAQTSFKAWTRDAASASAALSAWSVADSGGTQDLMDISIRISQLLAACAGSQRAYLHALSAYRTSLKDVLEREMAIKTVVRDREILVGRLIKLGNKKPADSALDSHQQKLEDAQRELTACEAYLQDEEAALTGVKRRTFREALAMRMKSMGELGKVMEDSAREAIELLSQLGQRYPEDLHYPNYPDDLGSAAGDSITPSYSASQALSRTSSNSSFSDDATPYRDLTIPASHKLANGTLPDLPSAPRDRRSSTQSFTAPRARSSPAPRPIFLIPTAPGAATEPSFDIPRAPAHVSTRAPNDDSSDEEDARDFLAHATAPVPRSSMYRVQSPVGRLHRQTQSETSSNPDRGAGKTPRRGSFFGGIAALFKKKKSFEEPSASGWETRTDRHVFATTRGTPGGGRREDESDEEDMPKNVVRVVNDPKARLKALSDVGAKPKLEKKRRTPEKAMSDVGVTPSGMPAMRTFPTSTSLGPAAGLQEVAVGKKRKKKVSTATATTSTTTPTTPTTLVLSPNGEHYSSKSQAVDLSRSNTMTTIGTTTTGTIKRKRKKVISAPPLPIPTAADLASSLPSARSNATLYGKLDEPVQPEPHVQIPRKAPKSLAATETRGKKDHALHGNGNWVAVAGAEAKKVAVPRKVPQGPEQEESLMSIVEREANGVAEETSRKYGPKVPTKEDVVIPRPQSSLTAPGLVKRKSVRLAEGPYLAPPSSHSPPSSIRSDPLSAHSTPRPGILVNNGRPLSSATLGNGESAWETRLTTGRGTAGADSSDEDEGYGAARRQFAKGTSKLESWIGGKGKGREV